MPNSKIKFTLIIRDESEKTSAAGIAKSVKITKYTIHALDSLLENIERDSVMA
jgi:hypothetical protein